MTSAPHSYAGLVAAEIRGHMARKQRTGVELARYLGITQTTLSRRLTGRTAFDLDEIALVAEWLELPISVLVTPADAAAETSA